MISRTYRHVARTLRQPSTQPPFQSVHSQPQAGTRFQCQRQRTLPPYSKTSRCYSTPPTAPQSIYPETIITPASAPRTLRSQLDPSAPPPPGGRRKRFKTSTLVLAAGALMLGLTAGQWMRMVIAPPALPLPGTHADEKLSGYIRSQAEKLEIVRRLEGDPNCKAWDAYEIFTAEQRPRRITTGPLGGSRGIGAYQRIFRNLQTGEFVSVIWIGGALAGWPGVCHGGLIATILDESLGRCAISAMGEETGVTANLEIDYRKPVLTNQFYVVRARLVEEGSKVRKQYVRGSWEGVDGGVLVEAKGLFVVPKGIKTRPLKEGF